MTTIATRHYGASNIQKWTPTEETAPVIARWNDETYSLNYTTGTAAASNLFIRNLSTGPTYIVSDGGVGIGADTLNNPTATSGNIVLRPSASGLTIIGQDTGNSILVFNTQTTTPRISSVTSTEIEFDLDVTLLDGRKIIFEATPNTDIVITVDSVDISALALSKVQYLSTVSSDIQTQVTGKAPR